MNCEVEGGICVCVYLCVCLCIGYLKKLRTDLKKIMEKGRPRAKEEEEVIKFWNTHPLIEHSFSFIMFCFPDPGSIF